MASQPSSASIVVKPCSLSCKQRTFLKRVTCLNTYLIKICSWIISSLVWCSILSFEQGFHWSECKTWWRHQMETFSALLAICAGNSPVPGEFPTQRPVTRSFDVYFDLRPNKWLSKQSWGWWFETPSRSLWRHRNDTCEMLTKFCN